MTVCGIGVWWAQTRSSCPSQREAWGALSEVAKHDGLWNWCLVGPDAIELPLAAGGMGGVTEMRAALGQHANLFGLLRMTFGVEADARTEFVCVHVFDPIACGEFNQWQYETDSGNKSQMIAAIHGFAACVATIDIESHRDCIEGCIIKKLCRTVSGPEAKTISVDSFTAALEHRREQLPNLWRLESMK